MATKTDVTVIVPNFNHAEFLEDRLSSIYNQDYESFEVILLDDCSTDNSAAFLESYASHPKTSYFLKNEQNSGSTFHQWNKGIGLAKGEFIWIAESDDYCEKDFLWKLVNCLRQDSSISMAFSQSFRVNNRGMISGSWYSHTSNFSSKEFDEDFILDGNTFIEKFLIYKNVIPNVSAVLFRSECLKTIYPLEFHPFMKYTADWFYYIQLAVNKKVAFLQEPLNYFRFHENSVIAKADKESGWNGIFQMELKGRFMMLEFLKANAPENISRIRENWQDSKNRLLYLTAKGYRDRGEIISFIFFVCFSPALLKKFIREKIKKL